MNLSREQVEKLEEKGRHDLIVIAYINDSGYAGITQEGRIVDRRLYPEAQPVPENKMLGIPKAKEI